MVRAVARIWLAAVPPIGPPTQSGQANLQAAERFLEGFSSSYSRHPGPIGFTYGGACRFCEGGLGQLQKVIPRWGWPVSYKSVL
jgi:hypothetical protein